jgi:hypothetical protein
LRGKFGLEELDEGSFTAYAHHAGIFIEATHGSIVPSASAARSSPTAK